MSSVRARKELYTVLGNNDNCAMAHIIREHEMSGVHLLRNELVLLMPEIELSGVDYVTIESVVVHEQCEPARRPFEDPCDA
jgi:hypothetical protein